MSEERADRTAVMNARLRAYDTLVRAGDLSPQEQCGVLIMATVLAVRRVMDAHGIVGGKRRKLVRDAAVKEFTNKLRTYTMPPVDSVAEELPIEEGVAAAPEHVEVFSRDTMAGLHGAPGE